VEPAEAIAHVSARLPEPVDPRAREALALVDLVGLSREDAAVQLEIDPRELSYLLVSARKALRRTLEPLPAGGWCERAERLISDRLDGVLTAPGAARLDAHLRGCERCMTHERRLIQAHNQLVHELAGGPAPSSAAPPTLHVVEAEEAAAGRPLTWYLVVALVVLLLVAAAVIGALAATNG
jgi:hypothetical protein